MQQNCKIFVEIYLKNMTKGAEHCNILLVIHKNIAQRCHETHNFKNQSSLIEYFLIYLLYKSSQQEYVNNITFIKNCVTLLLQASFIFQQYYNKKNIMKKAGIIIVILGLALTIFYGYYIFYKGESS